jgi:monoamine oxidase
MAEELSIDVAIVGAGFAGLSAALDLVRAGHSVVVLEANDRVGGRVLNHTIQGSEVVDLGAQWIGPGQDRIAALAREVGVETFPTYGAGLKGISFRGGERNRGPAAGELGIALAALEELAASMSTEAPWEAPDAATRDAQTVAGWLAANVPDAQARNSLRTLVGAVFSTEPEDFSLLHLLFYARAGGSLRNLIATEGGAQQDRFDGGAQLVALRVAERLGDRIRLACPVQKIRQSDDGVIVEGEGFRAAARRTIVAVPPHMAGRITYDPPMPALRDQLTQRTPMGSVIKVQAIYDSPFWRDSGLSGRVSSDTGPLRVVFDGTPLSGTPGVLVSFFEGNDARVYGARSAADRREVAMACLERYFGGAAARPIDYVDHDWGGEPYIRGAYSAMFPPGVWTNFGRALRAPVGRIHWAGTETSTVFYGYMDGAVRSGERAAEEVLNLL